MFTTRDTGSCTQWGIYDEYIRDLERQRFEENLKTKGGRAKNQEAKGAQATSGESSSQKNPEDALHNPHLGQVRGVDARQARYCTHTHIHTQEGNACCLPIYFYKKGIVNANSFVSL
jgi:hypothetical protein